MSIFRVSPVKKDSVDEESLYTPWTYRLTPYKTKLNLNGFWVEGIPYRND